MANFGLSVENVFLPFLFIILPFLSITIPLAFMFAVLIGFSRLSSDGEFTAMQSAGYSLYKALIPVILIGATLYGIAATCALYFEPWGRRELIQFYHRKAQTELDNLVRYKMQPGVFVEDFLGYVLYAEKISSDRTRLENVMVAPSPHNRDQEFTLFAPGGSITGSVETGDLKMSFDYGVLYASPTTGDELTVLRFRRSEIDLLRIFQDQILGADEAQDDFRSYPPKELYSYIREIRGSDRPELKRDYQRASFLFHQRLSMPLAAVSFALFAVVFGVTDQRQGKSRAWVNVLLTIMVTYLLTMSAQWLAENGYLLAAIAGWTPHIIMLVAGGFLVYQKNRLPPSESTIDPRNLPYFGVRRG